MSEKLNGIHGSSLFIDGVEILRLVKADNGEVRIALGAPLGMAIAYLDDSRKLEESRHSFLANLGEPKSKLH
jgi:hypothetical protein